MTWVIAVIVVLAGLAVAVVALKRRRHLTPIDPVVDSSGPAAPTDDEPMTGLESALAQVTGRDGRPIGERIDAEAEHVDELRVPDDTGPLLRRALDHVVHVDGDSADASDAPRPTPRADTPR